MKHIIRRFVLALSLMAGIAPVMAQAPGPVPALPDAERRTSYSISASTCACNVNFALYGDGTDYANWVEVFVNGVLITQSGNWTLTSPSGSFASLPRPISDAVLTFTAAQTGTVQIVGARRPRRTSQFSENRGVAARDLNQAITDLVAMLRENWDKTNDVTGRAVLARPGETLALLPVLASRQNMGACFDSGGNLTSCVAVSSSTFSAGNGILFTGTNPTTITNNIQAGSNITITGTNPLVISGPAGAAALYARPQDYGAKCDGVTDDTTAIQAMLTANSGNGVFFPAGTCVVSSTTLNVPSNIVITGVGREVSVVKSLSCVPVFTLTNVVNVTIEKIWIRGTDACVSWASGNFGAIQGALPAGGTNWTFRSLLLSNFNSNYWAYIAQTSGVFSNLTIDDVVLTSTSSDAPGTSNNINVGIQIQSGTLGSRIENTVVNNVQVNGTDICIQLILYSNFQKFSVRNSRFLNAGGANTNGHCTNGLGATNAYGIAVYDLNNDGNPPQDGIIQGNYILNPIATGIYLVAGSALTRAATTTPLLITGNEISGQTHTDTALPRGAIAANSSTDVTIAANRLRNNAIGINSVAQTAGVLSILNNDCYTGAGSSICLNVQAGSNGSSNTDQRVIRGNYFEAGATSVNFVSATGARFNNVDLSGNTIVADSAAAGSGLTAGNLFISGIFNVKDNTLYGPSSGAMMNLSISAGNVGLMGNTFNTPSGNGGILFSALPAAVNGSQIFVQDGASASSPCTGAGTGATAMRQNGAWKCF